MRASQPSSMKPIAGSDCASESRSPSIFAPPRMCSVSFLSRLPRGRPAGLVRDRTAIRLWSPQENPCRADRCRTVKPYPADLIAPTLLALVREPQQKSRGQKAIPRSGRRFQISWPASSQHWNGCDHSPGVTCPKRHEHDGTAPVMGMRLVPFDQIICVRDGTVRGQKKEPYSRV
jgi:hypothetical protein